MHWFFFDLAIVNVVCIAKAQQSPIYDLCMPYEWVPDGNPSLRLPAGLLFTSDWLDLAA
jgi:hypothetical protein